MKNTVLKIIGFIRKLNYLAAILGVSVGVIVWPIVIVFAGSTAYTIYKINKWHTNYVNSTMENYTRYTKFGSQAIQDKQQFSASKLEEFQAQVANYKAPDKFQFTFNGASAEYSTYQVPGADYIMPLSMEKGGNLMITSLMQQSRGGAEHKGVDIVGIPAGHTYPVVAMADGKVTLATKSNSAGNWVHIDHGSLGIVTVYMHMKDNSLQVKVGDTVKAGDVIGIMGNTGKSTGPHLHFEVRPKNAKDVSAFLSESKLDTNVRLDPGNFIFGKDKSVILVSGSKRSDTGETVPTHTPIIH